MSSADERGEAGVLVVPIALLGLLVTALVVAAVWQVVAAATTVADAARVAGRTWVEHPSDQQAPAEAERAARRELTISGLDGTVAVDAPTRARCEEVTVTVSAVVPAVVVPWVGELWTTTVEATHSETADPHRGGSDGEATC